MSSVHWLRPDIAGDLVAVAFATGAAAPREIRIRPELYARMVEELPPDVRPTVTDRHRIGAAPGVPLVIDPALPASPGFEVVREPATAA
ncbi:hypothetical protein [Trujillonella endophytica]|uniref:Uncharacterized protein n=1 Tax=Trujillonella endophytica TaxID=673521 RepID=A0A1H8P931_9ACTN|nr:hypothetical protein [Trujillella endophytica]SEO38459.1 hypothetical protein SAMN05660991_00040 [Trujillella endophytica]